MKGASVVLEFDETILESVLRVFLDFNYDKYGLSPRNTSDYELLDFMGRVVPQETNVMALNEGDRLELVYKTK